MKHHSRFQSSLGLFFTIGAMTLSGVADAGAAQPPQPVYAYVTLNGSNSLVVIDTGTNTVSGTSIAVGTKPVAIAFSPSGKFAGVTNNGSDNVSVVQTSTNTVAATIAVGANPIGAAVAPNGKFAVVANSGHDITDTNDYSRSMSAAIADTVSVIDTTPGSPTKNTVVQTIAVGLSPRGIAITPDSKFVYVSNAGRTLGAAGTVSVIDTTTNTVVKTITVGNMPKEIAITPNGKTAYVANFGDTTTPGTTVSAIDIASNTVVNTITVGNYPKRVVITADGKHVGVSNSGLNTAGGSTVSVIDTATNTVSQTINVCPMGFPNCHPEGIAVTPNNKFAYVAINGDPTGMGTRGTSIAVIDTKMNTVVSTINSVGNNPNSLAIMPGAPVDSSSGSTLAISSDNTTPGTAGGTITPQPAPAVPAGASKLTGVTSPTGFVSYVISGLPNPGDSVVVTFTNLPPGTNSYVKCPAGGADCVKLPVTIISSTSLSVTLTDGNTSTNSTDDDTTPKQITDPGQAFTDSSAAASGGGGAMSPWWLLIMGLPVLWRVQRSRRIKTTG